MSKFQEILTIEKECMGGRRLGTHFWPPNVCEPIEVAYNDMTPEEKATLMLCELL